MSAAAGRVSLRGITRKYGAVTALDAVDLDIGAGEFFALLGPSGSGKTTTLRIVAGLEATGGGTVAVDGQDVTGLAPGERDVAMVFQSYALYPHMTVAENISFPLRMVGTPKADTARAVRAAAERVKIEHLLGRRPGQLSGGQQQRCALARAIVRQPRLFLLDEPLSNLDAKLRVETRVELKKLHLSLNVTTIYVTHDQEEAMTIADRMAIFFDGRIVQVGTPEEVFERPASIQVASFLGSPPMNLMPGSVAGRVLTLQGQRVELPHDHGEAAREVVVGIRPGDLRLADDGLPATIYLSELLGETTIVNVRFGQALLKLRSLDKVRLGEGEAVRLAVNPANIHLFDRDSGERIALG